MYIGDPLGESDRASLADRIEQSDRSSSLLVGLVSSNTKRSMDNHGISMEVCGGDTPD